MRHLNRHPARHALGVPCLLLLAACARQPAAEAPAARELPATTPATALVEVFPGVRIDRAARIVEFDASIPVDCHNPSTPNVYLELIACTPDTREHEVLAVTRAKPSHIHAALLMLGLEPGKPAHWTKAPDGNAQPHDPTGPRVGVEFVVNGETYTPSQWIVHAITREPWPDGDWLFSGSVFVKRQGEERYDADWSGTLIGLTSFGTEVLAWKSVISPEAAVDEPVWIANTATVPRVGTPLVVRLTAR